MTLMLRGLVTAILGTTLLTSQLAPSEASHPTSDQVSKNVPVQISNTSPVARRSKKPCGTGLVTLDNGDLDKTRPRGLTYIVMEPWEAGRIPSLRRSNPGIKILMYKDVGAVRYDSADGKINSTGLSYNEAANNGWILTARDGSRIEWSDYPGLYPTNVGAKGYQDLWYKNVVRELRMAKWDGVMIDDTMTILSHPTMGNKQSVQIPDNAAQYRATESMLRNIGPKFKRAGFMAVPNISVYWDNWEKPIKGWSKYVSGWENEFMVKWGLERSEMFTESNDWAWKYQMAKWLASKKIPLLGVTYSNKGDRAAELYQRATWLLTWNGRTGASAFVPYEYGVNHYTKWSNLTLGWAKSAAKKRPNGLYVRHYSRGLAIVNPTSRPITVRFGGKGLVKSNGVRVRTFKVPATSGELMYKRKQDIDLCR